MKTNNQLRTICTVLIMALTICNHVKAQIYIFNGEVRDTIIFTPNNTVVHAMRMIGGELTEGEKADIHSMNVATYCNLEVLSEATWTYNCHGYAWHVVSEGKAEDKVWINHPEEEQYLDDGSYIRVADMATAKKIWYGYVYGDHSAITTETAGYVISKWGNGPLYRHHINNSPYLTTDLHYYVAATDIHISGPSVVNSSGVLFTLNPVPYSTNSISWSVSGPFTISDATGSSVQISYTGTGTGTGVITATIINNVSVTFTRTIFSQTPAIVGANTINSSAETYTVSNLPSGASVQWSVTSGFSLSTITGNSIVVSRTGGSGIYQGTLTASISINGSTVVVNKAITTSILYVTSGIDFTIYNNSSYELENIYIELTGKLGTNNNFTTFISADPGNLLPGYSVGYPLYVGNDITAPGGTVISDIYLDIYTYVWGTGATVYLRVSLDNTLITGSYVNFSANGNFISDYLGNDHGFSFPQGSSIPNFGRRMLTVTVQDQW
jgi:hypothetical protein